MLTWKHCPQFSQIGLALRLPDQPGPTVSEGGAQVGRVGAEGPQPPAHLLRREHAGKVSNSDSVH